MTECPRQRPGAAADDTAQACSVVTVVSAAIAIGAPLHCFKLGRRVLATGAGESEGDRECRGHTAAEARPAMPACMPGAAADRRPSPVAQPRRRGDAADAGHQLCALPMAERPRQRPATGAAADETACSLRITHEASPPAVGEVGASGEGEGRGVGHAHRRWRGGAASTLQRRPAARGLAPVLGVGMLLLLATGPGLTAGQYTQTAWKPVNGPPSGGSRMTIYGQHFGLATSPVGARVGGTACTNTAWTSDSSIGVTIAPAGVRTTDKIVLTLQTMQVHTHNNGFTFDAPQMETATASNAPSKSDGRTLTIAGHNFGAFDISPKARVGDTSCEFTVWKSGSTVFCKVPAGPPLLRWFLFVAAVSTALPALGDGF